MHLDLTYVNHFKYFQANDFFFRHMDVNFYASTLVYNFIDVI